MLSSLFRKMDPSRPESILRIDHSRRGRGRGHYHYYRSTTSIQDTENDSNKKKKSHQEDDTNDRYANSYGQNIKTVEEE